MARRTLAGLRVLVTGASSGIGRALALELARHGCRLLVTARRGDRLEALVAEIRATGAEIFSYTGDVTDPAARRAMLDETQSRFGGLDVLVNNAGVGALGPFADASEERLRRVMEVNFFAPLELIRSALSLLRAGQTPIVVNVSSVLGHRAVPLKSEYCASKFALHGMSDSLRAEFAPLGIDVLLVSPSTTDSEFFDNLLEGKDAAAAGGFGKMSADAVARATVRAIQAGNHEIILSVGGKLLVWLDRMFPWLMNRILARGNAEA